jgi:hypothetical protein
MRGNMLKHKELRKTAWSIILLCFTAVLREGLETVVFIGKHSVDFIYSCKYIFAAMYRRKYRDEILMNAMKDYDFKFILIRIHIHIHIHTHIHVHTHIDSVCVCVCDYDFKFILILSSRMCVS